ncbi:sugar kinase [Yinghuangia sp. ASG 101]|uniref:sugar kinase n=1 Tax=Yinghuangia sp. ASG 101 TaxID=2896848 RepID=UPI001E6182C4|nr:sugar kinase [Yinghuangia sp. ASG 101]UGQ09243.1 sugar kinase [Yinghuangia sp. ASG 101]
MSTAPVDVVTLGETMAALRGEGPLRLGGRMNLSVAGAESNVAIGLARLGHRARWIGRVGADEPGALVLRTLRAEGVDLAGAAEDDAAPTGLILFEPRIADIVRVQYYRAGSAGSRLRPSDIRPELLDGARVLHITGVTCALGPGPAGAVGEAVALARSAGVAVCLDVNFRARLWDAETAARVLRPLAALADIVVASDDEIPLVAAPDAHGTAEQARSLLSSGATTDVVVKRGGDGAELHTASGRHRVPARQVPVRDTVGAGDAFCAGYLSAWLDGANPADRLERGNTLGAFAVAAPGDWEGLPTRAELGLLDRAPGATER